MAIELKNIDLDNISLKEQMEKVAEETKELQEAILNKPVENILEEFLDVVQANLGLLSKFGISADRVMEYYPKHLEKLKFRPRVKEETTKDIKEYGEISHLSEVDHLKIITKDYDWSKLKDGDLVIVTCKDWEEYGLRIAKEYNKNTNNIVAYEIGNEKNTETWVINKNDDYVFPYTKEVVDYINNNCEIDWNDIPKYTPVYVRNKNNDWIEEQFIKIEDGKYRTFKGCLWEEIKLRYDNNFNE